MKVYVHGTGQWWNTLPTVGSNQEFDKFRARQLAHTLSYLNYHYFSGTLHRGLPPRKHVGNFSKNGNAK